MNVSASIRKLTQLFIVLFIALSGGLVYWQVVVAQQVTANVHNGRHCLPDNAPIRGRIFDRNGMLLAESVPLNGQLHGLDGKPIPGAPPVKNAVCGYLRHYNEPSLAGVIGYFISPLFSSAGIEKQYNDYLSGERGLTSLNNTINETLHRPPVGDDIYLTIDVRIQKIVNQSFDEPTIPVDNHNVYQTNRGSVIVTDPHTGEIRAMLSRPGYDPNKVVTLEKMNPNDPNSETYYDHINRDPEQPLLNRPLDARYVPGSTYKTLTLLAGIDSGHAHLTDQFDMKQALGPITVGSGNETETIGPVGNNIEGYTRHFPVDLMYGFTHSDNIIFAQVGVNTGVDTWLQYNDRFFVGHDIFKEGHFDLPVAVSSVTRPNGQPLGVNGLAENSFGQGFDFVTPFQMSLIDNAIANNGTLMRPMIIKKIVDPNGAVIQSNDPQVLATPVSDTTASQVRNAMYSVVRCGSGSLGGVKLQYSPWAIIAKTGTGEVDHTGRIGAQAWLLTQAPYQGPQLTIVAQKENGGEGGYADGPMVTKMYDRIFSEVLTNVPQPPPPDPHYCDANNSHY